MALAPLSRLGREHILREIRAVCWAGVALFLIGALAAAPDLDAALARCDATPSLAGPFGACVRLTAQFILGWPATILLPLLPIALALRSLGRLGGDATSAALVGLGGAAALIPVAIGIATAPGAAVTGVTGLWGSFTAFYLTQVLGTGGAWLAFGVAVSALLIVTLAWSPLRFVLGRWGVLGAGGESAASDTVPVADDPLLAARSAVSPGIETVSFEDSGRLVADVEEMEAADTASATPSPRKPAWLQRATQERSRRSATSRTAMSDTITAGDGDSATTPLDALPSPELLNPVPAPSGDLARQELEGMGKRLLDALATFRVQGRLTGYTTGPVVTQFEVEPAPGMKVRQFANLANDLALAMRAPSIRVVAPIPGRGAVGIEVPNPTRDMVSLRELIESAEFRLAKATLPVALGKDIAGRPVIADLAKMPHLLIAGATGAGKSVCVNTIVTSLVYRHTPATLRLLMVDPKMVELSLYNTLPHLRHKVIVDNKDAAALLKWAVLEMNDRYALLAENHCRNLGEFNARAAADLPLRMPPAPGVALEDRTYTGGPLPYLVVIIDELADLMMTVQGEVETPLALLAQKARAIGLHLILATQRPSVNVITGVIKANFPSRIAFRVASQVDSRTIIDGAGAEMLLGYGDMLFVPPGSSEPSRLQGAFISSEESERLVGWFEAQRAARQEALATGLLPEPKPEADILQIVRQYEAAESQSAGREGDGEGDGERDRLFREAAEICVQQRQGSTSLLQRKMRVGYGRAARLVDQLHEAGILGPPDGSKGRECLVGLDDLDRICGPRQ